MTEGVLRASNRAITDPGYDLLGMPYHRGLASDRENVTGADKASARTLERMPLPKLAVWRGAERGSWVELPVIPSR